MNRLIALAFLSLSLWVTPAIAHEYKLGDLEIDHPYAPTTPKIAKSGIGYFSITNHGAKADTLIGVKVEFARAMLHMTQIDDKGIARMPHMGTGIVIEPGATVALEPGGLHVMFMGLSKPFSDGEHLSATLVFEHAGEVEVEFNVEMRMRKPAKKASGMTDHSNHGN